jgi:colanic acid biosynthesis protein WcaH
MKLEPCLALPGTRAHASASYHPNNSEISAAPLDSETFASVVACAPLVAIDLIIDNGAGQILLGLRRNAPARDYWFVPGGRVYKNEPLHAAMRRISYAETGREMQLEDAEFHGVYEHFYDDNFADDPKFGTHYVVLAYRVRLPGDLCALPPAQHSAHRWISISELLTMRDVHSNTKTYFL